MSMLNSLTKTKKHLTVVSNPKLAAIEWLESPAANGITLYLDNKMKTALVPGNSYIHAENLVDLVELLKIARSHT